MSNVFTVYNAKEYPGMLESPELVKWFVKQGMRIPSRSTKDILRQQEKQQNDSMDSDEE
jgi:hypothetical protein